MKLDERPQRNETAADAFQHLPDPSPLSVGRSHPSTETRISSHEFITSSCSTPAGDSLPQLLSLSSFSLYIYISPVRTAWGAKLGIFQLTHQALYLYNATIPVYDIEEAIERYNSSVHPCVYMYHVSARRVLSFVSAISASIYVRSLEPPICDRCWTLDLWSHYIIASPDTSRRLRSLIIAIAPATARERETSSFLILWTVRDAHQLSAHWFRVLSTCRGSRSSSFPSDYVSLRAAVAVCHFQPFSLIFFSAEHSCLDRERSLQSRPTCIVCWLFFISFLMVMDGPSATHPTATIGGLWLFSVTIKTRHAVISIITCIIRSKYSVLPVVFCEREKKTIWKWSATVWYCVLRHFQRWDTIQKIILGDIARPLIVTSSHHIGWFITFLP